MGAWGLAQMWSAGPLIVVSKTKLNASPPVGCCGVCENSLLRCSADLEHALDGQAGAAQRFLVQFDARMQVGHAIINLFEGVHFHELALVSAAVVSRSGDKSFFR